MCTHLIRRRLGAAPALVALALALPATATAQGPSPQASCNGILSSLVAHAQQRDDVAYFVRLGAEQGLRRNSGEFFSFFAQQHAGSADACEALVEP